MFDSTQLLKIISNGLETGYIVDGNIVKLKDIEDLYNIRDIYN